ncbi:MAG TPA: 4Fe-4S double cluster binding domain-containing protein, partial [Methanocella sp.]|nr:4Fe-4S double cluster binding domain-containing protein [Methanocella sp.]
MKIKLIEQLGRLGYAAQVVRAERVDELRESIEAGHRNGLYDEALYQEYLSQFVFSPEPGARSLIVAAMRQPMVRFTFTYDHKPIRAIVPPTYLHSRENDRKVEESLAGILGPEGYRISPAVLPKKLLAVRSGLASYGRNNVTFIEGMGSFHRLTAFYSDMPCGEDGWRGLKALERCDDCGACARVCPTGAIAPDRFLLHAERCIVFHNEHPGEVPFPAWIDPSWHNCLVGCMFCQKVCPEDKPYLKQVVEGPAFSEKETALILSGADKDRLPAALAKKL